MKNRIFRKEGILIGFLSKEEKEFINDECLFDDYRIEIWSNNFNYWMEVEDDWNKKSCISDPVNEQLVRVVKPNHKICESRKDMRKRGNDE